MHPWGYAIEETIEEILKLADHVRNPDGEIVAEKHGCELSIDKQNIENKESAHRVLPLENVEHDRFLVFSSHFFRITIIRSSILVATGATAAHWCGKKQHGESEQLGDESDPRECVGIED